MTTPSSRLGSLRLDRTFTRPTLMRGQAYARSGCVLEFEWSVDGMVLSGRCDGSGPQPYRQVVRFGGGPSSSTLVSTACSCPMESYCKHVAALLIVAARTASPQPVAGPTPGLHMAAPAVPPAPTWRTAVAAILEGPADVRPAGTRPLALVFGLSTPSSYSPTRTLTLRAMIAGARQSWIKTGASWQEIASTYHASAIPEQHAALRAIYRVLVGTTYSSRIDVIKLANPPRGWWRLLAEAADAGVAFLPTTGMGADKVQIGTAALRYAVVDHPDGALLDTEVIVDDCVTEPSSVEFIGLSEPHGVWRLADGRLTLAPLEQSPTRAEIEVLRDGRDIVIPAADLPEFGVDVLPRLAQRRSVRVAEGLLSPPRVTGPHAVLTLTDGSAGPRYFWSTGYEVNDAYVVFDPDAPIGPAPYREPGAEAELWEQILPQLRVLAGRVASWQRQSVDSAGVAELRRRTGLTTLELAVICGEVLPELREHPEIRVDYRCADEFRLAAGAPTIEFGVDDDATNDWFDLAVTITVGGQAVPIADVLAELSAGATHMVLPDNQYFALDTPELTKLAELMAEARSLGEIRSGRVSKRSLNPTLWEELLELGVVDKQLAAWRKRMSQLAKATPPRSVKPSRRLKAELRDYQRDGLNWLTFLWKNDLGGVLADDMGLGKTVQTLALMARAADANPAARFLVVAPTSVVANWAAECEKFVPGLKVSAIVTTERRSGVPVGDQIEGANVVVTSYTLLRLLFGDIDRFDWDGVIFDEAQFIKNHMAKTHQCARRLNAPFKLAITGTPMENNLMELWSLLSVTVPGLFPSPTAFGEYFRKPIESGAEPERLATLRRRIKPVMLRRTKGQVAIDLPPKQEQTLVLDLAAKHRGIYDARLARERQKVLGLLGDWENNRFEVLRSLTMLRQLSLHAALVDSSHHAVNSAKVDYLSEQLPVLIAEGHSALVFSQFTGFLDILRAHLDDAGIAYTHLDGSMSARRRAAAVEEFTKGVTRVFLISLKAGGFGLNLVEADYCFVCDPWWNPAAEAQAVDRAHRIGQQRPVTVYRMVSGGTIEEQVVRLQDRKRALFDAVVDEGELFGSALSAADIREMLA